MPLFPFAQFVVLPVLFVSASSALGLKAIESEKVVEWDAERESLKGKCGKNDKLGELGQRVRCNTFK